jgi:peptide/nickel transport system ATP-binding protein
MTPPAPPSQATDAPVLDLQDIWIRYGTTRGGHDVVRGISLALTAGEIVGIQGPSGCGKSTLLRVASTLQKPTRGTVRICGNTTPRGWRRDGTVMPVNQNAAAALDPHWPIWRTITEPLTARHRDHRPPAARRREIAREQLQTVGLDSLDLDATPGQLSGGQCQRIAILRALIAAPRLLVADEPTAALDVSVAAGVLRLLADAAARGIAILIASHDRTALQVLCHRVAEFHDGQLRERHGDRHPSSLPQPAPSPASSDRADPLAAGTPAAALHLPDAAPA